MSSLNDKWVLTQFSRLSGVYMEPRWVFRSMKNAFYLAEKVPSSLELDSKPGLSYLDTLKYGAP